jgi:hypothetical protein
LSVQVLEGSEPWSSFQQRWSAFIRPTDLLCGWGYFASEVLKAAGAQLPPRVDVRIAARRFLRRNPGEVQDCAAALDQVPLTPWAPGRTGVRLSGLTAVVRALSRSR